MMRDLEPRMDCRITVDASSGWFGYAVPRSASMAGRLRVSSRSTVNRTICVIDALLRSASMTSPAREATTPRPRDSTRHPFCVAPAAKDLGWPEALTLLAFANASNDVTL